MTSKLNKLPLRRRSGRAGEPCLALKVLPMAVALCFCPAVRADVINPHIAGLPMKGSVIAGTVTGDVTGNKMTLNQSTARAVIDWNSFNILPGKEVHFVQPSASAAVLNRVSASADMSQIAGTMTANGTVVLMNPNGVLFSSGATINVGSLIVTTGTVNQTSFMAEGPIAITGAITGSVVNEGSITAANAGLVALVAPSVRNQGVITATGGRIALSGADRATVSLNGGLYEFAVDSGAMGTNASITNAAGAALNGATILMSTGDAANLVSGVINLQGVQQASSAIVVDGNTVVLKSDLNAPNISGHSNTVQVHDTASIQDAVKIAKTGTASAGATVELQAGTFNEQVTLNKAGLTLTGQAGAKLVVPDAAEVNGIAISANNVTVQGMEIAGPINSPYYDYYATSRSNISRGIAVGDGVTGFVIQNNNIHDVRNGILIHGRNSTGTVSNNRIENTKSGISVQYTDATGISIAGNSEGSIGNEWGLNLHLNGHVDGSGTILSNSTPIAAAPTSSWQQSLLNLSTANNGWAVQDQGYTASNRTQVNVAASGGSAGNQGSRLTPLNSVQGGIDAVVIGGRVNVLAGEHVLASTLNVNKAVTLAGAGEAATTIDGRGITAGSGSYGMSVSANDVTLRDFTFYGPSAYYASAYGIKVSPGGSADARLRNFTIRSVTSRGAGKAELDLNGVDGALIDGVTLNGAPVGNDSGVTEGAGLQLTDSANVTVRNTTTRNNNWGGLALYQANRSYNQQVNNITVEADNHFNEVNPVYLQDESASRDFGSLSIAGFDYAVRNAVSADSSQYTWLQATKQKAYDYAVNLTGASSSYIQGWNGAAATQNFEVGVGNLSAGGNQAMSIGTAINQSASGASIHVGAGTYAEQLALNKAGLTLTGQAGAKLVVPDAAEVNGIAISANNVTVQGMEIAGPINGAPYYDYYATPQPNISRGIAVGDGVTGFTIQNNNIHDVRNGILIHGRNSTGTVSNNRIENTKSGISVQYTDATGISIAGNSEGSTGNEWGLNLHLNGHVDGTGTILSNSTPIASAPTTAWQQSLLSLSTANNGWAVQDQGYTASNRTRVTVATTGAASNQGSRLTPINTLQGGVNAVVAGGKVNVNAGTYAESVSITKALTLDGAGAGQSIIDPVSSNAVTVSGNIGAGSTVLIDGFTFRDAPSAGVSVEGDTVLGQLTVQNSEFRGNGAYGFTANGSATAGIPGLAKVSLLDSTFAGNGAAYTSATSLGQGDIHFNYYNGDATLRNLTITGSTEHTGIHFRGYHNASTGAVYDAGTWVFDNVTLDGSFRRPSGSAGTWNPSGPGHAIHLFEYGSVANVSFNDVKLNQTVGHGLFLEGLSSTLNIGNTAFGVPDSTITGTGTNPTYSMNIVSGANSQNNVKTNVDATHATFTGAASGFDIEDRVGHALDATGLGLVTWNAGNLYVTQTSGSVQRGIDAASVGNTVNVGAGSYGENVSLGSLRNLNFNGATLQGLTLDAGAAGSGIGGEVTVNGAAGITFNAAVNLLANTTLATTGSNIALNGDVQNAGSTAYALTLTAGSSGTRGNVQMSTGGTQNNALGQLEVKANRFSLTGTLRVKAYKIDALGDVALSNNTLRALGAGSASTLAAAGNVTGSTTSQGDLTVTASGDVSATVVSEGNTTVAANNISGAIGGSVVAATAQKTLSAAVTASSSATLVGDSIQGSVSAPTLRVNAGRTVALALAVGAADVRAGVRADLTGRASSIGVNAPHGDLNGSFDKVDNTGDGVIKVNGRALQNDTVAAVIDNLRIPTFVLPPPPPPPPVPAPTPAAAPTPAPAPMVVNESVNLDALPPTASGGGGSIAGPSTPAGGGSSNASGATSGGGNGSTSSGAASGGGSGSSSSSTPSGGGSGTSSSGATTAEGGSSSSSGSSSSGSSGSSSGSTSASGGSSGSGRVRIVALSGAPVVAVSRSAPGKAGTAIDKGQAVEIDLSPGQ